MLPPDMPASYATPQDVENAFYDAIRRADLDAFMSVWAEDEEVLCILPSGPRITGYANIREAWRRIFAAGHKFEIRLSHPVILPGMLVTVHSLHETIIMMHDDEMQTAPILATNIYLRSTKGWRLMVHHASATLLEDDVWEAAKTLH